MFIQRVTAESIAVSGTGATAVTTITVDSNVTFAPGCIYDFLITAQVPAATDGTIVAVTNGTVTAQLMELATGNYVRARGLGWRKVIRAQFFADPDHLNLLCVKG